MNNYILFADAAAANAEAAAPADATVESGTIQQTVENAPEAPAPKPQSQSPWAGFMMPLLLILLFYFVFLKPQQRREKERRRMIETLRVGAKVVFANGVIGTIVEAKEKTFVIETAPSTQMEVLRSAVQELVG